MFSKHLLIQNFDLGALIRFTYTDLFNLLP